MLFYVGLDLGVNRQYVTNSLHPNMRSQKPVLGGEHVTPNVTDTDGGSASECLPASGVHELCVMDTTNNALGVDI
jgi:hypothetical protein